MYFSHRKLKVDLNRMLGGRSMAPVITDQDLGHMKTFSENTKRKIISEIMIRTPVEESNLHGNTSYAKAVLKLRARGLELIELQPQETALTTVWYSQTRTLLGCMKLEVAAMLIGEFGGHDENSATLRIWRI